MSQPGSQSTLSPQRQPFLYLTAALIAGILVERYIGPGRIVTTAFAVSSGVLSIRLLLAGRDSAATLLLLLGFGFAGTLLSSTEHTTPDGSRLERLYAAGVINPEVPVELTATLLAPPEPAPGAYYLDAEAESLRDREQVVPATGRARLMISVADREAQSQFRQISLDYGSRIRVLVRLERARAYSNPGSPDFNEFLARRGFDLKGNIKSALLIEQLEGGRRSSILRPLYRLRLLMMDAIDSSFEPRVAGTLKAMLTGNRYFLDHGTAERLRESSTFHTLVIAGLHIGIIAWALLGGRSAVKRRRPVRVIACLLALWAYAIMVGLAPPVTRATTMITIGIVAPLLFRRSASTNTVALAAFVMLALKPALLADPGFQLSFVAVGGIVTIALPLTEKLRSIGQWRPGTHTPHPPSCLRVVLYVAETMFWNEREFIEEMRRSPVRYHLRKAKAARLLGRLRIQPLLRGVLLLVITSGAIQLTTLPLMALYFNRVAPIGMLLNVIAGLLTGVLMLTAIGVIAVAGFSVWIAARLAMIVNVAHYLLVNAIAPFSNIPLATFRVAHHEGWHSIIYVLYFVPLAMLVVLLDRWRPVDHVLAIDLIRQRTIRASNNIRALARPNVLQSIVCLLSLIAVLVAVIRPPTIGTNGRLAIYFLDVGQGDCALIVFPHGKTMLVDGGGELRFDRQGRDSPGAQVGEAETEFVGDAFSIGEAVVSRFIWSRGRTRVDYVLATHAHADHIGGLADVARNFGVGQVIVGHAPVGDREYDQFAGAVHRSGISLSTISAGERFEIDGVAIEVLWPRPPTESSQVTSGNNDSVVLRLVYGSRSILLAGDIERATEGALAASGVDLRADILKVPHHGSRTSSTAAFIDAVNPKYAVISVGEHSRFGHPHASVVERYRARDVTLLQTGRDGMVTMVTDGNEVEVKKFRN